MRETLNKEGNTNFAYWPCQSYQSGISEQCKQNDFRKTYDAWI